MPDTTSTESYSGSAHLRIRLLKNRLTRYAVAAGGMGVIVAILLIFIYLLYIVAPLAKSPSMQAVAEYPVPSDSPVLYLAMEEQAEIGVLFSQDGGVRFFATADGNVIEDIRLPIPEGVKVVSFSAARPKSGVVALGLDNGQALVVQHRYRVSFPGDQRLITPSLEYPLGREPIEIAPNGAALSKIAIQEEDSFTLVGWTDDSLLTVVRAEKQESLLEEGTFEFERSSGYTDMQDLLALLIDPVQRNLFVLSRDGRLGWFDISDLSSGARLLEQLSVVPPGVKIQDAELLASGASIMIATDAGTISQWFTVRDETGARHLQKIRDFELSEPTTQLVSEFSRKGFLTADRDGTVAIFHATAHQKLIETDIADSAIVHLAIGPRADALLALDAQNRMHFWHIENEHPEISWKSLWSKVWYEGYDEPAYIWQSSAANNDFEPKFSLTPLTFGTLKAAFYAMLVAIPLAILGAIFTAYFMAPRMRQSVKPTIEIMEALPTVILGFLAGLWLAPLIESHLPGLFTLLLVTPLAVLVAAWIWSHLPAAVHRWIPDGWEAALLVPVLLATGALSFGLSPMVELWLFDGNMPGWLKQELGIDFDQRNSLVIGIAMGFAVIPTIFSIAEDAIFSVPRHLTNGSLALGATTWQTLVRVVLLTASPGIFSAVMMGVGRAVGETMIVLMATGNTPIMDLNIFEGMRTLSANIAVEMPESEVGSTHYRVLFLAALVLFILTFLFNTGAELIRQRLRNKYSSL
ncbi:MAG: ABC transporter permease subunit [Thiogranum sp.]|nr:ABC transporter permease subunit [Thiogranum sp.]